MIHDDDNDSLAEIDLHTWRVPPPAPLDRPSLVMRALAPAAAPAKRPRLAWLLAAILLLNAALVAVIVILLARGPEVQTTYVVQPAGNGSSVDVQVRELLIRLEREQRELQRKLTEIQELRALVLELSARVRAYEQQDNRRDRDRPAAKLPEPARTPEDPYDPPLKQFPADGPCDEVSCVLQNYEGTCCLKYRKSPPPIATSLHDLPEFLDRNLISKGVAAVKPRVLECSRYAVKGIVKVSVVVGADGNVKRVTVKSTPDENLGACVARAVQSAVFAKTQVGGSFGYPFVF